MMSEESWEQNIPAEASFLASHRHSFISTLESGRCEAMQARSYWLRSLSGYQQGSDTTKDIQITFLSHFPLTRELAYFFQRLGFEGISGREGRSTSASSLQPTNAKEQIRVEADTGTLGLGWSWPQSLPIHSQTRRGSVFFCVLWKPLLVPWQK